MFTKTEKGYLVLTLAFLAAGSGIKAYRHAAVKLGPFQNTRQNTRQDSRQDARDARETQGAAQVPEAASTTGASTGPDSEGASTSAQEVGLVSRGDHASQSNGTGGRDTVSDSSNGSADPFPHGPVSVKASESHGTVRLITTRMASRTVSKTASTVKVDLNRAEASELTRVPGIGAKTARAIVDYRRAHGPYRDFRDLLQIKGIGEKKLEKLMPNLIL